MKGLPFLIRLFVCLFVCPLRSVSSADSVPSLQILNSELFNSYAKLECTEKGECGDGILSHECENSTEVVYTFSYGNKTERGV